MKEQDLTQAYLQYYARQRGGQLVVFRGSRRWQKGDGFGDRMRGVLKWAMPVLSAGASTFISETAAAHSRGENMSEAAKSALKPTVGAVIDAIGKKITDGSKSPKQGGSGRRHKKKRKAKKQKPVYKGIQKGGKSKRKHKAKGKVRAAKATKTRKVKKAKRSKAKRSKVESSKEEFTKYNF